jgi:hypothetical protein
MALEAGACDFLSRFEFAFENVVMIHMHRLGGQIVCGVDGWLIRTGKEIEDREEDHKHDSEYSQCPRGKTLFHTFSLTEIIDDAGTLG